MRALPSVLSDAQDAVNAGDATASLDVLRELFAWVGYQPNPAEAERLAQQRADPAEYLALPVVIAVNPQVPGQIAETPQGSMCVFTLQLVMPLGNLRASRLLLQNGHAENPADGMGMVLEGRWLLPRRKVATHVLQALGLEPPVALATGESA